MADRVPSARVASAQKFPFVVPDFGASWKPQIVLIPFGFGVAECVLTPDLAELFLAAMVEKQRRYGPPLSSKYASDMAAGDWRITHQGCAFNIKGEFFDGQHRCHGVIESQVAVQVLVFFGVGDQEAMAVTDTGKTRTVGDAAKVLGVSLSSTDASMVRQFLIANGSGNSGWRTIPNTKILDTAETLKTDVSEVRQWFAASDAPGVDRAPIRAAVLCAKVYGVDHDTLARFVSVLCDKVPGDQPTDAAAVSFRKWIAKNVKPNSGGASVTSDLFLRACRALECAARGEDPQRCTAAASNPFRTPDLFTGEAA